MARKTFTDESLATFVDKIKSYTDSAVSTKANSSHSHSISNITNLQTTLDGKASTSVATQSANGLLRAEDKIQLDYGGIPIVATSGDGTAYTATVDGMTELKVGAKITIIPHVVSAAYAPTLNVNGLGAKAIRMPITYNTSASSNGVLTNWLVANKPVTVQYNGSYWLTVDLVRPSAQYLYGAVPMANGGTEATDGATGLANLFAAGQTILSSNQYGSALPSSASEGTMFFKKATGTVADIDTNLVSELMLTMYPVDSIYMSTSSTSPAELFGGTWMRITDRFLLAASDTYTAGSTGGEETHTLTVNESPYHEHSFKDGSHTFLWGDGVGTVNINGTQAVAAAASGNSLYTIQGAWASTNGAGGSQPHNNMPPYLVVYMWKRTA